MAIGGAIGGATSGAISGRLCALVAAAAVAASGCGTRSSILDHSRDPKWLGEIAAPALNSEADVDNLWQSKPRCCNEPQVVQDARVFYKACSDAVDNHPDDDYLVVKCLWLMDIALDGPQKLVLHELLLGKYFNHKASLRNCVNCAPGDIVMRVAAETANEYASLGRIDDAIALLERALDRRGADTSPWVRIEATTQLGRFYMKRGPTDADLKRIQTAYDEFQAMHNDETIVRRWHDFETVYKTLTAQSTALSDSQDPHRE